MPIRQRETGVDVTLRYLIPDQLYQLFEQALPIGTVMTKRQFIDKYLGDYETRTVQVEEKIFSIRPAWTAYHSSPSTHLIVIGHILFCHIVPQCSWLYQPSIRLFTDNAKMRLRHFKELVDRATTDNIPAYAALAEMPFKVKKAALVNEMFAG
jgi:hypothetical protein